MDINENLIGLWRLDTGAGLTAFDTSGNGNDGTLEGTTPTWIDGISLKAVNLPGVNERIDCGNGAPLDDLGNGSFWLSFWMKSKDSTVFYDMLFTKGVGNSNIELAAHAANNRLALSLRKVGVGLNLSAFSAGTAPFDTLWNHIVLVINRTTDLASLYMNTIKDATEIDLSTVPADVSNTFNLRWGVRDTSSFPYAGAFDELRIYTGVPTQAEIDALYNYPEGLTGGQIAEDVILTEAVTGKGVI